VRPCRDIDGLDSLLTHFSMKLFITSDVRDLNTEFPRIQVDRADLIECPLWWHKQGLQQTSTGYGRKLTNSSKINFNGKLYRLYTTCFSNVGSTWFTVRGKKIYVS
jgi:hypothetical protein